MASEEEPDGLHAKKPNGLTLLLFVCVCGKDRITSCNEKETEIGFYHYQLTVDTILRWWSYVGEYLWFEAGELERRLKADNRIKWICTT